MSKKPFSVPRFCAKRQIAPCSKMARPPKKQDSKPLFSILSKSHIVNFFNFLPCISHKKDAAKSFRGIFLRYDCPCGQAMSYEVLRTVMIGFAKLLCSGTRRRISYGKEVGRAKIPKIDPMPQDFGAISFSHRTQCRRILERFCLTVTRSRISYGEGVGRAKAPISSYTALNAAGFWSRFVRAAPAAVFHTASGAGRAKMPKILWQSPFNIRWRATTPIHRDAYGSRNPPSAP